MWFRIVGSKLVLQGIFNVFIFYMAHAFQIIPAKPTFGNFAKQMSYSEMLENKNINALNCDCDPAK